MYYHITSDSSEIDISQYCEMEDPGDIDIYRDILSKVRKSRLDNLLRYGSEGKFARLGLTKSEVEQNPSSYLELMASLYEIVNSYEFSRLRCLGCIYNEPGQLAHMDHPYGCLHSCDYCV